ncbi:MAG: hypothetical protein NZM44_07180, partial [Candidatus Calescibacterium sp.]|nr:hypothetical protein [Candidatus Calescibacterium sp.]
VNNSELAKQSEKTIDSTIMDYLMWDICNPWAYFSELSSTHPLLSKRFRRLLSLKGEKLKIGSNFMGYLNFVVDVFFEYVSAFFAIFGSYSVLIVTGYTALLDNELYYTWTSICSLPIFFYCIGSFMKYSFAYCGKVGRFKIEELLKMTNVSVVRSVPVIIEGTILEMSRYDFFSDFIVVGDETGIIIVQIKLALERIGLKYEEFIGSKIRVKGYYRRTFLPYVEPDELYLIDSSFAQRKIGGYEFKDFWLFCLISFFFFSIVVFIMGLLIFLEETGFIKIFMKG